MTVRTLIVDDSPTMRALLSGLLRRDPDIEVIGTADRASVARAMIKELDPDVITLDIEMPEMNGLDFLDKIMRLRPTPTIINPALIAQELGWWAADGSGLRLLRAFELWATDRGAMLVQLSTSPAGPDLARMGYRRAEQAWVRAI